MFAGRFFAPRFFAASFFAGGGAVLIVTNVPLIGAVIVVQTLTSSVAVTPELAGTVEVRE